jgi:hypothetical protein
MAKTNSIDTPVQSQVFKPGDALSMPTKSFPSDKKMPNGPTGGNSIDSPAKK